MRFLLLSLVCLASSCAVRTTGTVIDEVLAGFEKHVLTSAAGHRMHCHQRGGEGPALVLVPGTWGDIHRFAPLIERLPRSVPIAVVELCWQAGNVPPTLDLTIEGLADDVLWVVRERRLGDFFVGGHSIGGMITVELVGREVPGLLGAVPMEGWTDHTVVQTAFSGEVVGELTPAEEAKRRADRARGFGHLSPQQRAAIATIWRRWNGYEALVRASVPVRQIWGDRGRPRPDRAALQIPENPSIEIEWIPDASHLLLLEAPDEVTRAVLEFLSEHS